VKKEALTSKQGSSLIILYLTGNAAIMALGSAAKEDFWLAIIGAVIFAWIVTLQLSYISSLYPGKNLFEICESLFGRIIGKFLVGLFTFYTMQTGGIVLRNGTQFVNINGLTNTPIMLIMLCIMLLAVFLVKNGMKVMGKWAELFAIIFSSAIFILVILAIPKMNFENVRPFLYRGVKPVIVSTFYTFGFPFGEIITFSLVFSTFEKGEKVSKVYRNGLIIGGGIMLITSLHNALVIGVENMNTTYYPTYFAATKITVAPFLQRTEVVLASVIVIASFAKTAVYLLASCIGIAKLFNCKDYKFIVTPVAIIFMIWSFNLFKSVMELREWDLAVWKEFSLVFQAILPTFIFISAIIKKKIRGVSI